MQKNYTVINASAGSGKTYALVLNLLAICYLTDIGMTGSYAGVIGMKTEDVIARFTSALGRRAEHSTGEVLICAAVIDVDEATGRAREIFRLSLPHEQ